MADQIDPARILNALEVEATSAPVRVTGGQDAAIWRFVGTEGAPYALRVIDARREVGFRRELAAMRLAREGGAPVPEVRTWGQVDAHLGMVTEWCAGRPMLEAVSSQPWRLWSYSRLLGREQARLQQTKASEELETGAPGYWLARSGADDPIAEALRQRGLRNDALIHLDFHPLNVLVEDGEVSGIIDWTNAAAGDPRADFAMTASILCVGPIPPGPLRPVLRVARRLLYGAWRGAYEKAAGRVDDGDVAPFMAWAGTTMLHEMEPRARQGRKWPTMADLDPIRGWIKCWSERAGLAS
jgi:aminoglycoside phosphotransferase (APT) family kinase protein